jgi:hypothetical protein
MALIASDPVVRIPCLGALPFTILTAIRRGRLRVLRLMEEQTRWAENSAAHAALLRMFVAQLTPTVKTFLAGRSSAGKAVRVG